MGRGDTGNDSQRTKGDTAGTSVLKKADPTEDEASAAHRMDRTRQKERRVHGRHEASEEDEGGGVAETKTLPFQIEDIGWTKSDGEVSDVMLRLVGAGYGMGPSHAPAGASSFGNGFATMPWTDTQRASHGNPVDRLLVSYAPGHVDLLSLTANEHSLPTLVRAPSAETGGNPLGWNVATLRASCHSSIACPSTSCWARRLASSSLSQWTTTRFRI